MKMKICTFHVEELRLGIDVGQVQEILRHQEITHVPLAPDTISGLLNLRGQIVMVTDLKKKFGLAIKETTSPIFIILRSEEGPACFMVDSVGEVLEIEVATREPLPPQLKPSIRDCASGVYSLPDGLVIELEADKLNERLAENFV